MTLLIRSRIHLKFIMNQATSVLRLKAFGLKPHRADGFKLSNDSLFAEKVYGIAGLYLDPPESAVLLSVDENPKSKHCRGLSLRFR